MSGKILPVLLIVVWGFPLFNSAEVIKMSVLEEKKPDFSIKRDIFSPVAMVPTDHTSRPVKIEPVRPPQQVEKEKKEEKDLEAEIRQGVSYEGYIIKKSGSHALLNVNGEYFVAGEGDSILGKIKVDRIERKIIVIEVESKTFEIELKGEEENEGVAGNRNIQRQRDEGEVEDRNIQRQRDEGEVEDRNIRRRRDERAAEDREREMQRRREDEGAAEDRNIQRRENEDER